jgi:hypothetical protein
VATIVSEGDVIKMISSLSNWGRWGAVNPIALF